MPTSSAPQALTVPDVLAGLQCPKHLWWRLHEPAASELVPDPARRLRAETELGVSALARERFVGGELIGLRHQGTPARLAATDAALARGRPVFHAAASAEGVLAAIDVLEPAEDGSVAVVEVAASTEPPLEAVRAAAVQAWVLERSGRRVREVAVLHLDAECRHPELDGLFRRTDVTARTAPLRAALSGTLAAMRRTAAGPCPDAVPGAHCTAPTPCPFLPRCRPAGTSRRPAPTAPVLEHARPVAYLVLRTVAPAIPRWPGCRPLEPVPVQLSCHLERPAGLGGGHRHVEWLAEGGADPRRACARALLAACAPAATVVVDDRDAVRSALAHLRAAVPDEAAALAELETRCVAGVLPAWALAPAGDGPSLEGDGAESWELHRLLFERDLLDPQELHLLRDTRLADAARRSWMLATGGRVARMI